VTHAVCYRCGIRIQWFAVNGRLRPFDAAGKRHACPPAPVHVEKGLSPEEIEARIAELRGNR
jgi:hypothetical protein